MSSQRRSEEYRPAPEPGEAPKLDAYEEPWLWRVLVEFPPARARSRAASTRSGVIGMCIMRTPVALAIALGDGSGRRHDRHLAHTANAVRHVQAPASPR